MVFFIFLGFFSAFALRTQLALQELTQEQIDSGFTQVTEGTLQLDSNGLEEVRHPSLFIQSELTETDETLDEIFYEEQGLDTDEVFGKNSENKEENSLNLWEK